MQLLLIIFLLMGADISEALPLLTSIGDEDMQNAIKNAEEIEGILTALTAMTAAGAETTNTETTNTETTSAEAKSAEAKSAEAKSAETAPAAQKGATYAPTNEERGACEFPLAPIADIADAATMRALADYITTGR